MFIQINQISIFIFFEKVRTGMVSVSDGKSKSVPMRLHLSMEVLKLQREDLEVKFNIIILCHYYFICMVYKK